MDIDFAVTVVANTDPERGVIAEGSLPGRPIEDSDYDHVRAWVRGMLYNLAGALPAGWDLNIDVYAPSELQRDAPTVDPRRAALALVDNDRMALVQVNQCRCGMTLRRDRPDGIWYHVPDCADPTPTLPVEGTG